MKSRSIKVELAGAFTFLLLIVAGLGVFSIDRISVVNGLTAEIGDGLVPSIQHAGAMNTMVAKVRIVEARLLITSNDAELAKMQALLTERLNLLANLRTSFEPLMFSAEERSLYGDFATAWDHYLGVQKRLLAALERHDSAEAHRLFIEESFQTFERASGKLNELVALNVAAADAANKRGDDIYASARNLVIGGLVVVIVMTVTAVFFLILNSPR